MNLEMPGGVTSASEVTNISSIGFWLLVDDYEYFIPFGDYTGFNRATISQIFSFVRLSPTQFYWPDLDIDIELESLKSPDRFPLIYLP